MQIFNESMLNLCYGNLVIWALDESRASLTAAHADRKGIDRVE
jgi:hypothetical protein